MENTIRSTDVGAFSKSEKRNVILNAKFWTNVENNRFGIIPLLLVVIGCAGGLAAAFGAHDSIIKLGMVAFPTIITASLVIGVAPMKSVFFVSAITIFIDLIVLIF